MKNYFKPLILDNSRKLFMLTVILLSPLSLFAAGGTVPSIGPVRVEFIIFGLILLGVMLLAPLLRCGCFRVCPSLGCLCPPHFTAVCCWLPELFRVEHHSPFMSLGNAALATSPNSPSSKSSQVVRRASSTHVTVCSTCTVQSRTRPWPYSVVDHVG